MSEFVRRSWCCFDLLLARHHHQTIIALANSLLLALFFELKVIYDAFVLVAVLQIST